jgi:uncharacterized protein (TIGR00730 family)
VPPIYFEAAQELGKLLVQNDFRLVYGGGKVGLMGEVSSKVLQEKGEVIGVIPQFMIDEGWCNDVLTQLVVTADMHTRKKTMAEMADAIVAMPGGCGTLEELLEIITWKQLGLFTKPIVILNVDGYYDDLLQLLDKAIDEKFMRPEHAKMWRVAKTPAEVFEAINNSAQWETHFRKFAAI